MHGQRFFLYCQHLSGAGHFVRTCEIARALAERHEVYVVDGGIPVPRPPANFKLVPVPRLQRDMDELTPLNAGALGFSECMRQRSVALRAAVERIRPDVLVIEHFPFSKWELAVEILTLLRSARAFNPHVKVVSSVRDFIPASRHGAAEPATILRALQEHFDAVLVHGDPAFSKLEDHLLWRQAIPVPVHYTGIVSEKLTTVRRPNQGNVVVSGGGVRDTELGELCIEAWSRLHDQVSLGGRELVVFMPLSADHVATSSRLSPAPIRVEPFSAYFLGHLARADLSISRAGYNTCANLLETRMRSILIPNPRMADQVLRARRLSERGLAVQFDQTDGPERLAAMIKATLSAPRPQHNLDLNGAARTRVLLEVLLLTKASWRQAS